jgi:uncharacterized membrane protein YhaH (DUF805 family)
MGGCLCISRKQPLLEWESIFFSGRAKRSEYWQFHLFVTLMGWGASLVGATAFVAGDLSGQMFELIVFLVFITPTLAVGSRRLHDIGKTGWWQLLALTIIGIILLIVWFATGTKEEGDKYGEAAAETA